MNIHFPVTRLSCWLALATLAVSPASRAATWGADSHPTRTVASHGKRVIGYLTQWDAWKDATAGLPVQGYLNHLNLDYSQYTHLNFSFFGVASDGSIHSGDFRNQNIYQTNQVQSPAPLLDGDVYSSWDYWLVYGDLNLQWDFSNPAAAAAGFMAAGGGWSNTVTKLTGPLPVPLPNTNGAPGLLALAHAKGVKVMASIGGWSMCKHFPATAADPAMRARFVADCQRLMTMGFDGIDFDWEYPGPYAGMNFTGSSADYANFLTLIQQVRTAIGTNKEISICLSATPAKLNGFDWPSLASAVDSLNLMTYDFQGGWSATAGHNAPLYPYPNEEGGAQSASACVADLLARGVAASKIAMGVPFYGRGVICSTSAALNAGTVSTFTFAQPDGPIITCADYSHWSVFDGAPDYSYLRNHQAGWTRHWDTNALVPYLTTNNYFLSYDDSHSIGLKAQYVRNQNLGGVIIWNAFADIIPGPVKVTSGDSGKLPYSPTNGAPLVNVVNSVLAGDPVPPDNTEGPVAPNTPPALGVADASVVEGNAGMTNLVFNLTLSSASTGTVSVAYSTADGAATAPGDYLATNGTVTFAPGQTVGTISVRVLGDTNLETDEVFYLNLTNVLGASLSRTQAVGTVLNDDSAGGPANNAGGWPTNLFAPYVDFTAWPPYDLVGAATNTGLRYATLAFIVADTSQNAATASPTNIPAWGGYTEYSAASGYRLGDLTAFRALGGDVVVSFGGESGTELAGFLTDTNRLKAAYQFVINTYAATRIDFDIEGAATADTASINRRSAVMAALQADATAAGRTLQISLTLPVLPTGLDNNGLQVLRSAVTNHVTLACVNIMAMDYGDSAAPNPSGHMGDYAIMAATNLFTQLKSVYAAANLSKTDAQLWQLVGVTPLLGVNDVLTEVFDPAAATQLVSFAGSKNINLLAFWSLNRDQPGQSGITQTAFQFTGIFLPFGGGASPAPVVSPAGAGVVMPTNGFATLGFPVSLSPASTGTVSVAFFTSDGTAAAPGDYLATNGTLVFAPGQTVKTVSVTVPGHTNLGPNKVLYLNLTNASGANLFIPQAAGTITNANVSGGSGGSTNGASGGECALTTQWLVTYDGAAFRAVLTLGNPNSTNITINRFAFDAAYAGVDWIAVDANLTDWVAPAHSGNHFTISSGWNPAAVIPAGGSLALTFQASPGGTPPAPTHLIVNGVTVGGCGSLVPVYFTGVQRSGNDVLLAWKTLGGGTNRVQMSFDLVHWTNVSSAVVVPGSGSVSTNWTDVGGATNAVAKFYRVLLP